MDNNKNNDGKNPLTGSCWNCSHCHATNHPRQEICGCAKSRVGTSREIKSVDDIELVLI